jgi:hypothetical protein
MQVTAIEEILSFLALLLLVPSFAAFIQAQAWVCRAQAFLKACEVQDE